MVVSAADRFTIENAKVQTFTDFLNDFSKNPLTGYLAMVENETSVKQSLKNLILTERTERPYRNWIGSKVTSLLFDPIDANTEEMLRETIRETIQNCEPRVRLINIDILGNQDVNGYFIVLTFSIVNIPQQSFSLEVFLLRRVR